MQALAMALPDEAPTVGNRVLIAKPPREAHTFESKMEERDFLCWDLKTIQGAYIACVRPNGH
eukprot:11006691-Prorocentrum_lima.AAC.1